MSQSVVSEPLNAHLLIGNLGWGLGICISSSPGNSHTHGLLNVLLSSSLGPLQRDKAIEAPGREPCSRSHRELLRELEQNQPLWPAGGSPKVVQIRELDCDYDGPSIA